MSQIRALLAFGLGAGLAAPQSAFAFTGQEAIALAQRADPAQPQGRILELCIVGGLNLAV